MARDVFPFAADRAVIRAFLRGEVSFPGEAYLSSEGHVLRTRDGGTGAMVWFDSAGALEFNLGYIGGADPARVAAFICEELGMPDRAPRREVEPLENGKPIGDAGRVSYYLDDERVSPGTPFVLAGPLTIQAYRAAQRQKP